MFDKIKKIINTLPKPIRNKYIITLILFILWILFIDDYNLIADYIDSQAFGFLAIRSYLNLPISFSTTTGCNGFTVGGKLVSNF